MVAPAATFLAVDDEPLAISAIRIALRSLADVAPARNLAEARERLGEERRWSGIFLDRLLPDGSGLTLLGEIRIRRPFVPVLIMTAYVDGDAVNEAFSLGARIVAKPCGSTAIRRFAGEAMSIASHIDRLAPIWRERYKLSDALVDLLRRLALGEDREQIAAARGTSGRTIQAQISSLLFRAGCASTPELVERFLREIITQ